MKFTTLLLGCALALGGTQAWPKPRSSPMSASRALNRPATTPPTTASSWPIWSPRGGGDDGFVSLFTPDGVVTNLKWIEGGKNGVELRDPLGVAS